MIRTRIINKKEMINWKGDSIFDEGEIYYLFTDIIKDNKFGIQPILPDEAMICDKNDNPIWFISDDDEEKNKILKYFYTEQEYRKLKLQQLNEL